MLPLPLGPCGFQNFVAIRDAATGAHALQYKGLHPFPLSAHRRSNRRDPRQGCSVDPARARQPRIQKASVKRTHLILFVAVTFACSSPAFAQRSSHPGGGPPAGHGPSSAPASATGEASKTGAMSHTDMSHASPSDVLSHNTAIAGKIKTLTGEEAQTACNGFKNLGQCVAAAHVAKNLDIPGGFDALKAKVTGTGSMSLGKAIEQLSPNASAKSETKKANKQAADDMKESGS